MPSWIQVEISFKNRKPEKSLTTDKGLAKSYGTTAKKVKQRYDDLKEANNLYVVSRFPSMRLHSYKGNSDIWSVDVYKNWRILFAINQDPMPALEGGGVDLKAIKIIKI